MGILFSAILAGAFALLFGQRSSPQPIAPGGNKSDASANESLIEEKVNEANETDSGWDNPGSYHPSVQEISGDMITLNPWSSEPMIEEASHVQVALPSPSNMVDRIQNTYVPSALRMASAVQASVIAKVPQVDFWEIAKKYEKTLQDYVPHMLDNAATYFKSTKFTEITSSMHHIVSATATFRGRIQGALDARHITLDALTEELERIFTEVVQNLRNIPSPDQAPGHLARAEMVDNVLEHSARALLDLAKRYGIDEDVVTTYLVALKPQVQALTIAVGDINEQHPQLLSTLTFSIATLLIPESWILRPFLSLFGFGPSGPIKGSAAAWIQKYYWGASVKAGSWFSLLQAAGMGKLPVWAGFVTNVPALVGGAMAMIYPRLAGRNAGG